MMEYLDKDGLTYFWNKIKGNQMQMKKGTVETGSGAVAILSGVTSALIYVQERKDQNSAPYILAFAQKQFTFAKRNVITLAQSSDKGILVNLSTDGKITVETFAASVLEYTIIYM